MDALTPSALHLIEPVERKRGGTLAGGSINGLEDVILVGGAGGRRRRRIGGGRQAGTRWRRGG